MADIIRPNDLTGRVWAEDGSLVTPSDEDILEGWEVGEKPPAQMLNYWQNRTDKILGYLLQKGIGEWDTNEDYIADKSFVSRLGSIYRALSNHSGIDPSTDTLEEDWLKILDASGSLGNDDVAYLLSRANHTGTQATSTITDLDTTLASKESTSNKVTNFSAPDNTTYPTTQAVLDLVSGGSTSTILMTSSTTNVISSYTVLTSGSAYEVDSSGGTFSIDLPSSPDEGTWIWLNDVTGSWETNKVTLVRAGELIEGMAENMDLDRRYWSGFVVFVGDSYGWVLKGA